METIIQFILEDWTGVLVQLFFLVIVTLMILDKQKPPILASVGNGVALLILALGGSFGSIIVASMAALIGLMWFYLAWQRYKQPKRLNKNANPTN